MATTLAEANEILKRMMRQEVLGEFPPEPEPTVIPDDIPPIPFSGGAA